jgi:integrase
MGMKPGENRNHPLKGAKIAVSPIKDLADIEAIKRLLATSPRNYCLFVLGVNSNLRASDILSIKAGDVRHLKPGDDLVLREKKTGKRRRITMNKAVVQAIQNLLKTRPYKDSDPLFLGRDGALTRPALTSLVKKWCRKVGLIGNFGAHSLRKSWGYHMRLTFGVGLPELMVCYNHSSQRETLNYLCIQDDEIRGIYQNEL